MNLLNSARTVESPSVRFPGENISVSAAVPAVRNGGTAIRIRCIGKRYMSSPVRAAADLSPPTAMHIGNTVLTPATSKRDSKEVLTVIKEQFEAERRYQASLTVAKALLSSGTITKEEYDEIDTILLRKYRPSLGSLFSDNG
jgi:hypothetical protein